MPRILVTVSEEEVEETLRICNALFGSGNASVANEFDFATAYEKQEALLKAIHSKLRGIENFLDWKL